MKIDQGRLERQEKGAWKWKKNLGKGTLEYPTGLGKTFVAVRIIMARMQKRDPSRKFLVVVPRIPLKTQWEEELLQAGIKNVTVTVINGLVLNRAKMPKIQVDMVVLDEIHRYAADEFSRVFDIVDYKYILGLTATLERVDNKHLFIEQHCPIVDTITPEEAQINGWVAQYEEFALEITMDSAETKEYERINNTFFHYFSKFGHDFDLAMSCLGNFKARETLAFKRGWAKELGDAHPWAPKNIHKNAIMFSRSMQQRKKFLYTLPQKVTLVEEIAKRHPVKTIMFSESTDFADTVAAKLGNIAVAYHSYVKPVMETYKKVTKYKTKPDKVEVKTRKLGKKTLLSRAVRRIKDNRYNIRFIATAKALDEGFNVPDIEMAILASYTSNPTQKIQRRGRAVRKWTFKDGSDKRPIIIYFYAKNTQEEKWLRKSLKNTTVKFVKDVDEIFADPLSLFGSDSADDTDGGSYSADHFMGGQLGDDVS
jgi:superfamily II DNA or RNA helicase